MNKIARIALNNLVLELEKNEELENEVKELNKYVEDFKERLEESEYNNRVLKNKIGELYYQNATPTPLKNNDYVHIKASAKNAETGHKIREDYKGKTYRIGDSKVTGGRTSYRLDIDQYPIYWVYAEDIEKEKNELNKYVEYLEERLFKSETNNSELRDTILNLYDQLAHAKSRHFFYATKFKQLLLQDKNKKYRVYSS